MYELSTQKNHRHILSKHLMPRFGETAVAEVTRQDIQAYVAHLTQAGCAPKSIDHHLGVHVQRDVRVRVTHQLRDDLSRHALVVQLTPSQAGHQCKADPRSRERQCSQQRRPLRDGESLLRLDCLERRQIHAARGIVREMTPFSRRATNRAEHIVHVVGIATECSRSHRQRVVHGSESGRS
jgi:hypothetical protein